MAKGEEDLRLEIEERLINEEFEAWTKKIPSLYDRLVSYPLECPSLTVQWLLDQEELEGKESYVQKMILGTHTLDNEPNYLMLAQFQLPLGDLENDDEILEIGGLDCSEVEIIQQINHDGEVKRARYMPRNPFVIATETVGSEVLCI